MRNFKAPPTNPEFYSRYAGLLTGLFWFGVFAQIVSAATEIGTIYLFSSQKIAEFAPSMAVTGGVVLAIIFVAVIEGGLRFSIPYTWRGFIRPLDAAHRSTDLIIRGFIDCICVGLITWSMLLSFSGSVYVVKTSTKAPPEKSTKAEDDRLYAERRAAADQFTADSAAVAGRYAGQISAVQNAATSKIKALRAEISELDGNQVATGRSFGTKRRALKKEIEQVPAGRDTAIAGLESRKATELEVLFKVKTDAVAASDKKYQESTRLITDENRRLKADSDEDVKQWGGGLGWFTVVLQLLFFLSSGLTEFIYKGAGIEQKVIASQRQFLPSRWAEWWDARLEKWDADGRNKVETYRKSISPYVPASASPMLDISAMADNQQTIKAIFEKLPDDQKQLLVRSNPGYFQRMTGSAEQQDPNRALLYLGYAISARQKNFPDVAEEYELKADDVLRVYLGAKATPKKIAELRAMCIAYLHGKAENPFQTNGLIGFKRYDEQPEQQRPEPPQPQKPIEWDVNPPNILEWNVGAPDLEITNPTGAKERITYVQMNKHIDRIRKAFARATFDAAGNKRHDAEARRRQVIEDGVQGIAWLESIGFKVNLDRPTQGKIEVLQPSKK